VTPRTFGKIDILINNAGINTRGGITEIGREEAISVFNTNLIGPFFLTQRVVNVMIKKEITGSILFTSSIHSHITQLHPAYSSSKAALEMFVKDMRLSLRNTELGLTQFRLERLPYAVRKIGKTSMFHWGILEHLKILLM